MASGARPSVETLSALILKQVRKGCLCSIQTQSFGHLIKGTFQIVHHFNPEDQDPPIRPLLASLTCIRRLVRAYIHVDTPETEDSKGGTICKQFREWILILVRLKFDILTGLSKLWPQTSANQNLRNLTESTFNIILTCLPCPSRQTSGDTCRKTCQKILENYIQLKTSGDQLGTSLVYSIFCLLDKELNDSKKQIFGQFDCLSAKIRAKCNARVHYHSIKQFATSELKQNWKTWMERSLSDQSLDGSHKLEIFTLWKSLVSVSSNLGYSQSKEFVQSACKLVSSVSCETNHLIKQKELDILNEVLCYGTTLGIQSTIPCEVSDLAQALLRQAKIVPFSEYQIPMSFPGFGGNQVQKNIVDDNDEDEELLEEAPSLCAIQGIVLLHLKSSALVVREAQCCTSSDSSASDSSLSSHGSSSIGDAEHEMKLIERNVMDILGKLKVWIIDQLELHPTSQLSQCIAVLFNEQDDALIESYLCLLDIFTGLHYGVYFTRHHSSTQTDIDTPTDTSNQLQEALDPVEAFDSFLQTISSDPSVILDFLLSNETCFLLYFLRLLKYLSKTASRLNHERSSIYHVLRKVHLSIKKLTNKSLFPYEISPVLRQLEKLVPLNQSTNRDAL